MAVYVYDGTFDGLLAAVALALETGGEPDDISEIPPAQGTLFHGVVQVEEDHRSPDEIYKAVAPSISDHALRDAFHAFLSGAPDVEMLVYRYLRFGKEVGSRLDRLLSHDLVYPVCALALKVRREAHRMKGFVRFGLVAEGFYYARIEPDYQILPLIAPHFADRFSDQHWIIHDTRRGRAIIHDAALKKWVIAELELLEKPELTAGERFYRNLWKKYFTGLAVEERLNPRLQRQNLPLKCRPFLAEMEV